MTHIVTLSIFNHGGHTEPKTLTPGGFACNSSCMSIVIDSLTLTKTKSMRHDLKLDAASACHMLARIIQIARYDMAQVICVRPCPGSTGRAMSQSPIPMAMSEWSCNSAGIKAGQGGHSLITHRHHHVYLRRLCQNKLEGSLHRHNKGMKKRVPCAMSHQVKVKKYRASITNILIKRGYVDRHMG